MNQKEYNLKCAERWGGFALRDAKNNWSDFEEIKPVLTEAMESFRSNPMQRGVDGKYGNPDGTLTKFLWSLQSTLEPDRGCLKPLLDFEEKFQTCFLRRGLLIYCQMLLNDMRIKQAENPNQIQLI